MYVLDEFRLLVLLGTWVSGIRWQNMFLGLMMVMKPNSESWEILLPAVMEVVMAHFFRAVLLVRRGRVILHPSIHSFVLMLACSGVLYIIFVLVSHCSISTMKHMNILKEHGNVWLLSLLHWFVSASRHFLTLFSFDHLYRAALTILS